MAKTYLTQNGDKCDSDYERAIIDDLIDRGVGYLYEEAVFEYDMPVVKGHCIQCGSDDVVQKLYRTLDITLENGIVVEVKGKFEPRIRNMMAALRKSNPDDDIRFMFMMDQWMTKRKARRYSDWARTKGFICAAGDPRQNPGTKAYGVGGIPEEWLT